MFKITAMNIFSKIVTNVSFNQTIFGQQAISINRQNKHYQSQKRLKSSSLIILQKKQSEKITSQQTIQISHQINKRTDQTNTSQSTSQLEFQEQQPENQAVSFNNTQSQKVKDKKIYNQFICQCIHNDKCQWIKKLLSYNHDVSIPLQKQIKHTIVHQIEKDAVRTNVLFPKKQKNKIRENLKIALILYCIQDPQICYIQGFNNIMGTFLSHSKNISQAFYLFRFLMKQKYFRVLYVKNFEHAKRHSLKICSALSKKSRKIYDHLVFRLKVELPLFVVGWIIPLFTNIIPSNLITLVFDGLFQYSWTFLYVLCLQIFIHMKQQILNSNDKQQVQLMLTVQSMKKFDKWDDIISEALRVAPKLDSSYASPY